MHVICSINPFDLSSGIQRLTLALPKSPRDRTVGGRGGGQRTGDAVIRREEEKGNGREKWGGRIERKREKEGDHPPRDYEDYGKAT